MTYSLRFFTAETAEFAKTILLKLTDFSIGYCHKKLFNSDISHLVIPA